jgi:bifunctional enzyme Fae/Hps
MLEKKIRYLQIAFNVKMGDVERLLPKVPRNERILVEAGTPFIKRYGTRGIRRIRELWDGYIVADIKTIDGAKEEVEMCHFSGANAAVVMGSAPTEALDIFIETCDELGMDSMVDMMFVERPLKVLRPLKKPPTVAVLHRGRDEERTRGKVIQYKQINKIKSKYDILVSAAGGVDLKEAQTASFNGANIVVVNIIPIGAPWTGITPDQDVGTLAEQFLKTIT